MTEEKENCNFQQKFGLDDKPCCYLYHKYCDEIDSCYFKRCKRLEQENKELKLQNENIINEYNRIQNEIIGDIEFKEVMLTGITPLKVLQNLKQRNRELQAFYDVHEYFKNDFDTNKEKLNTYRSALEEIKRICKCSKEPMNCDECPQCDDCEELCVNDENLQDIILDTINEVLQ